MSQDSTGPTSWQALAAELRACREKQQQTWGDLDHALIGRYLAGEVTPEERSRVEASLDEHPELRVLTEVVSEVLGESTPQAAEPKILSFPSTRNTFRSRFQRYQRRFALAAAACLLLGLSFVLNPHSSTPDRSNATSDDRVFFASRDPHRTQFNGVGDAYLLLPPLETELVAKADELVEKGEFEKAAKFLFGQSKKEGIHPAVDAGKPSSRRNHTVAKLTERVLKSLPSPDTDSVAHFPAASRGKPEVGVTAANLNDDSQMRLDILSKSVPYLVDCLNQKDDPVLRDKVANVLMQLGPRARQAEPVLEEIARKGCKEVSPKAREVLSQVRMPYWIGVRDRANVLTAEARERINKQILALSRQHQLHIVAETVHSLPTEAKNSYAAFKTDEKKTAYMTEVAEHRCQAVAAEKGVYVLICMDPPAVQVAVGNEAKTRTAKGWSKDAAQTRMQESMKKRDLDKGLEEVVQMIEQAIAE